MNGSNQDNIIYQNSASPEVCQSSQQILSIILCRITVRYKEVCFRVNIRYSSVVVNSIQLSLVCTNIATLGKMSYWHIDERSYSMCLRQNVFNAKSSIHLSVKNDNYYEGQTRY